MIVKSFAYFKWQQFQEWEGACAFDGHLTPNSHSYILEMLTSIKIFMKKKKKSTYIKPFQVFVYKLLLCLKKKAKKNKTKKKQ